MEAAKGAGMRTLFLIVLGLVLAGLFIVVGRVANRHTAMSINGAFIFVVCWTAFTLGDFLVRIVSPREAPLVELGTHLAVFVVPVAAALLTNRLSGRALARSSGRERRA
jgi:hypothetical protein